MRHASACQMNFKGLHALMALIDNMEALHSWTRRVEKKKSIVSNKRGSTQAVPFLRYVVICCLILPTGFDSNGSVIFQDNGTETKKKNHGSTMHTCSRRLLIESPEARKHCPCISSTVFLWCNLWMDPKMTCGILTPWSIQVIGKSIPGTYLRWSHDHLRRQPL